VIRSYPTLADVRQAQPRLANVADPQVEDALTAAIELVEFATRKCWDRYCPSGLRIAIGVLACDVATAGFSRVPDRATSVTNDTGTYTIARGDASKGRWTGLEAVDMVLRAHRVEPAQIG